MDIMHQLWRESRGNIIGGLVAAGVLALFSGASAIYTNLGTTPLLVGLIALLWVVYLGYAGYWLNKKYKERKNMADHNKLPGENLEQTESEVPKKDPDAEKYYPCFISYSSKDEAFAEKLYADLQKNGVRCWFAPKDMKIGAKIRPTLERSIQTHDKLMLILSENSINSTWVETEVETAFEKETKPDSQLVLFPIRIDDAFKETKEAWAAHIRRTRHIGDFSRWTDPDAYQQAFERLLRDLQAEG